MFPEVVNTVVFGSMFKIIYQTVYIRSQSIFELEFGKED